MQFKFIYSAKFKILIFNGRYIIYIFIHSIRYNLLGLVSFFDLFSIIQTID